MDVTFRDLSFIDPRLSKRLHLGAFLAAVGVPAAALLDVVRAVTGPRFQVVRGTEYDLWVEIVAVVAAVVFGCLVGAAFGPLWRRRGPAALLAAVCGLPLAAAQSIAAAPHGPTPYRVHWPTTLLLAALVGAVVAWRHPQFARDMADARLAVRAKRIMKE